MGDGAAAAGGLWTGERHVGAVSPLREERSPIGGEERSLIAVSGEHRTTPTGGARRCARTAPGPDPRSPARLAAISAAIAFAVYTGSSASESASAAAVAAEPSGVGWPYPGPIHPSSTVSSPGCGACSGNPAPRRRSSRSARPASRAVVRTSSLSMSFTGTPTTRVPRPASRSPSAEPGRRARRAHGHHHVGWLRQLARRHLAGDLEAGLHVPEHADRGGPARGQDARRPPPAVAQHQPRQQRHRPRLRVGEVELRAGRPQALELALHVLVHRLVHEGQHGAQPVLGAVQRGGQAPVGAEAAHGQDHPGAAPMRVGDEPLELPHLVAAPRPRHRTHRRP